MDYCARVVGHCGRCEGDLPFDFTMAFQPIVDLAEARVVSYEALVRGRQGESAWSIISQVTDEMLYRFDQACRVKAIELASELGMRETLSINFLPNAVYEPQACIQATLEVSERVGWPTDRIVFEITETEKVRDRRHLRNIINAYHAMGFTTALDDFGNGYANLDLLTDLMPDRLKIDRELVMGCDTDFRRQALVRAVKGLADELNIGLIAEGVETHEEAMWLGRLGINRQQGFYFARPVVESLGEDLRPRLKALREEMRFSMEAGLP
ncbi:EAL domain-containing protein [Halomonas sp. TRM85114]|uniref:EAL domain-containing protein n=1 Tax=Halomonas jincaotanensis TaxID=2810616 RepID=UPI001BD332E2|nr:EAL domain-containing protein [Halomonas jincaotanensis]MBS9403425.1 EAL domain-containing protein [Halomonas jincaotanensis]